MDEPEQKFSLKVFRKNIGMSHKSFTAGFTVLEFTISVAIILFISAQVFVSISALNQTVSLDRAVQELGYAVRRAQSMSLAVTGINIGGVYQIPPSIGIMVSSLSTENDRYFFFADLNADNQYSGISERIEPDIILPRGIFIQSISGPLVEQGFIIFRTPEATMSLTGKVSAADFIAIPLTDPVSIVLVSSSGRTKTVRVRLSGAVSIIQP